MSKYPFNQIEQKWQKFWEDNNSFVVRENPEIPKDKRIYVLDMFPYPSGAGLHVGHPEGYTATDIYSRFLRMKGYNILHPMGFDSFGLPAENYAIQTGTHPGITTEKNIALFRKQLKSLGFSYDWSREISTHTSEYYRWTQWIFLQLYNLGLAYEAETPINWCPDCKTGLANEEVKDGSCDRCGTQVTRKNIRQWILKITDYADRLLSDLDDLEWPESVKTQQRNWIGRSEGADVVFQIEDGKGEIQVFTTRPDTLFGATYMVLAPEHSLVPSVTTEEQSLLVSMYLEDTAKKSDLERTDLAKEKTGVFTGSYAINPVNGKKIPIWIADYVLISYGSGAIMAVPAHDERDWEFAKEFNLPIIPVLEGGDISGEAYTGDGTHINSGFIDGLNKEDAIRTMITWLECKGLGKMAVNYKLRDWIFSRQRYWGEPIPLVHCPSCGTVPIPEHELPVTLPDVERYTPSGTGESPLASINDWVNTSCPSCGGHAKRETNTMPQWAGSCWYYLRFLDPHNKSCFADPEKIEYWMPVDLYVGGVEHAVLHLLYARFWHKVLYDLGLVNTKEPFQRLVNQGMITSFAYQRNDKSLVSIDLVEEPETDVFIEKNSGERLERVVAKMSKSLKNVINPDEIIRDFGADSMRLYEMFMGPLQVSKPWSTSGLSGVFRFLDRVWRISTEKIAALEEPPLPIVKLIHKTIKKVSEDTHRLEFNTAIAQMMIFANEMNKSPVLYLPVWKTFLILLNAYAPHITEELWEMMGEKPSISNQSWPEWSEDLVKDDYIEIVVQINGKVRSKIDMPAGTSSDELERNAFSNERISDWISGKTIVKTIVVPDKLVNIVIR